MISDFFMSLGVKGVVRFKDGEPAGGLSVIVGGRLPVQTTCDGEFWKLLLPGNYSLKVSAVYAIIWSSS